MNTRTPENSRRLAQMVQGLEPEERWALLDRAEAAESWEQLEQGAEAPPAEGEGEEEIDWGNVASEVKLMLELNQGAAPEEPAEDQEP